MINREVDLFLFLLGAICLNYTTYALNYTKTYQGKCLNYGIDRLSFLQDSTRKFVHLINKDQPVEIVKEIFNNPKRNRKHLIKKVVSYEFPFLVVCGVLVLLPFIVLFSGIAIFHRQKKREAIPSDQVSDFHDEWIIHVYLVTVLVLSCLLTLTDVGLFLTNNRISESFPFTRKTLTESIDVLLSVQNNTMKELNKILRDDLERAVGSSMTEFRALAYCGSDIKYSESLKRSTFQLKEATQSALSALQDTREVLILVNLTLTELRTLSRRRKSELGKMDAYYKEAQRMCLGKGSFKNEDLCQMFVNKKDVFSNGIPFEVSNNVSVIMSKLDKFSKTLNFTPILEFIKTQSSIERRLCKKRTSKLKELEKVYSGIRFARNFALETVRKYSDELADKTLMPIRRKVNTVLARDSPILTYDGCRWWITFVVAFGVLIVSVITIVSVAVKGTEPYLLQVSSSLVKIDSAQLQVLLRRLFLSSVVLHVTIAVVVNVCTGIVFLFVANMAVACEMSTDYQHIDDIFGTSDLLKKSSLFNHGHQRIKLFKTISECPKSGTLWEMFNLDKKFNIHKNFTEVNKIPRITRGLFRESVVLNKTLGRGPLQMQNILEEWKDVGIKNINVDLIRKHAPLKLFQSVSNKTFVIEEDYLKMYSAFSKLLKQRLKEFQNDRKRTSSSFAKVRDLYSNITEERNLWNKNKNADHHVMKIGEDVRNFLKDGVSQVKDNVGNCGVLKQAYDNTVCSLCDDIFGSWNTWLILLLICSCLTTLSLVFCVLILKQVCRRPHSTNESQRR